jgi:hypothetical protein
MKTKSTVEFEVAKVTRKEWTAENLSLKGSTDGKGLFLNSLTADGLSLSGKIGSVDPYAGVDLVFEAKNARIKDIVSAFGVDAPAYMGTWKKTDVKGQVTGGGDYTYTAEGTVDGGSTSPPRWWSRPGCCSSTSRPPGSTPAPARLFGA